jgi:hypothetical protein
MPNIQAKDSTGATVRLYSTRAGSDGDPFLSQESIVDAITTTTGALTETPPSTDTASSGLNGRLARIAQRLTTLIGLHPSSLGQKTKSNSFAVTLASDSDPMTLATRHEAAATPLSVRLGNGAVFSSIPPLAAADTATAAANAIVAITYDAVPGQTHTIGDELGQGSISWSLSADPASAILLTVSDAGTVRLRWYITKGGPGFLPVNFRCAAANTALVISLAAAGAGVIGTLNIHDKGTV